MSGEIVVGVSTSSTDVSTSTYSPHPPSQVLTEGPPSFSLDIGTGIMWGVPEIMQSEDDRTFWAILSAEVMDSAKEFLTLDDLYKMMDTFIKRGGPIHLGHDKGRHVGKTLSWYPATISLPTGATVPAVVIKAQVFSDYRFDNAVWESILSGELSMVSIGTLAYKQMDIVDVEGAKAIKRSDFEPWHVALTPGGKNPISWIFKAGKKSFASRLQKQGVSLLHENEVMSALRSVSMGTLRFEDAQEIAKSLFEGNQKEDSTMTEIEKATPPQPVEQLKTLGAEVEKLKQSFEELKTVFTSLFEEKDGKMVLKELVIPQMNVGVNKQSVAANEEAVFKEQKKLTEIVQFAVAETMKAIGKPVDSTPQPKAKDGTTASEVMKDNEGADNYEKPTLEYFTKKAQEVQ